VGGEYAVRGTPMRDTFYGSFRLGRIFGITVRRPMAVPIRGVGHHSSPLPTTKKRFRAPKSTRQCQMRLCGSVLRHEFGH